MRAHLCKAPDIHGGRAWAMAVIAAMAAGCAGPQADAAPPVTAAAQSKEVAAVTPPPAAIVFPEEPFRGKQPAAGEPRAPATSKLDRFTLADGVSVYLVEKHSLPIVSMSLEFDGGGAVDPRGKEGLASVCAGLISDGTAKLDKIAFEEALADLASNVNSGAEADRHEVSMTTLRKNLDPTLDLWADALLRPGLRQEELDRNIKRRLAGLTQLKGNPAGVAGRLAGSIVYGPAHLHGRFPTETSYRALTLADCKSFVAERIKPRGARLFVVGDITRDEVTSRLGARLAGWSGRPRLAAHPGKPQPRNGKLFFVDIPRAAQSVVQVLAVGPPRKAPDFEPTSVMTGILGGGFTGRINMNIREKHGYAYGAGGGFQYTREGSIFRANASVRTNVTKESIEEMLKEIRGMAAGSAGRSGEGAAEPTEEELAREKDARIQGLPARFSTGAQTLAAFRELVYFGLPLDYWDHYVGAVKAVDLKAVKRAAVKHLRPADLQILVVGDRQTVLPKLEELVARKEVPGPVIVLDADGKPLAGDGPNVRSPHPDRTRAGRTAARR
jgi:zinc protease